MTRPSKYLPGIGAAAIIAVGVWLRVTSATTMPLVDADEAFFGIQANRILAGQAPDLQTYTGNVVSPFNAGLQLPLIAAFGPKWWILRVPTILAGLLAVAFAASMFRRSLDSPTAWYSAVLIVAWPVAIISSRIGYDAHLTPLLSVLVLGFAFSGRGLSMTLAWLASLSAHPTNLFLLPIALPVFVLRVWSSTEGDSRRRVRQLLVGVAIPSLIALTMGILKLRTPKYLSMQGGSMPGITAVGAWGFVSRLGRLLFGVTFGEPSEFLGKVFDFSTIAVILILFVGAVQLVRVREWDRLALIAGLAMSVAGFRIIGGQNCLMSPRYALFAVVPLALGVACSISAFVSSKRKSSGLLSLGASSSSPPPQPSPTRGEGAGGGEGSGREDGTRESGPLWLPPPSWGRAGVGGEAARQSDPARSLSNAGPAIRLASIGLASLSLLVLTWINGFQPFVLTHLDSPMTLRVEREDCFVTASKLLIRDSKDASISPEKPVPVYAETEWVGWPLMYLTAPDHRLAYSPEWAWKYGPEQINGLINQSLYTGGYVVGSGDGKVAAAVEALHPPQSLKSWDFRLGDQRRLVVYRLNRPGEASSVPVVFHVPPVGAKGVVR